jgi:hypothetical protein
MAAWRSRRSELKGRSGIACAPRAGIPRTVRFREELTVVASALLVCGATVADPAGAELTIDRLFGPMAASFAAALERPACQETEPTFGQRSFDPRSEALARV